ncbi:MAG: hypothetical protein L0H84_09980 [Pseudonocardia sp.]|nr:hypothetical protein [Pseudonocardia sp.]
MLPRIGRGLAARLREAFAGYGPDGVRALLGEAPLRDVVELLASAHGRPSAEVVAQALPAVRERVRHGLLVPA